MIESDTPVRNWKSEQKQWNKQLVELTKQDFRKWDIFGFDGKMNVEDIEGIEMLDEQLDMIQVNSNVGNHTPYIQVSETRIFLP